MQAGMAETHCPRSGHEDAALASSLRWHPSVSTAPVGLGAHPSRPCQHTSACCSTMAAVSRMTCGLGSSPLPPLPKWNWPKPWQRT